MQKGIVSIWNMFSIKRRTHVPTEKLLQDYMESLVDGKVPYQQLASMEQVLHIFVTSIFFCSMFLQMNNPSTMAELCERNNGRTILLTYPRRGGDEIEEVILKVQGYLLDYKLPPIRRTE